MDLIFPNKLFFEIFQYFDLIDLHHSFYNLNYRINCILSGVRFNLDIGCARDKNKYNYLCQHILPLRSKQFINLKIDDHDALITRRYSVDIRQFSNLRTLIIPHVLFEEFAQIRPTIFPYLTSLKISSALCNSQTYFQLCEQIFATNKFRILRKCSLYLLRHNLTVSTICQLEYLKINLCSMQNFYVLIQNLKLKVFIVDLRSEIRIPTTTITDHFNLGVGDRMTFQDLEQ
ncbi:unnamed protein product [Didymodactylos carnosus]|uniref:F-box domain-containing protein n=1 Tax=Didymodactylos carnosus TaxID=1234261 RepID=A0A8S2EHW5_9BILA|nr:unnamed protein product [Didymodactylos carnosus]CAF3989315.1 unnamed protein product [Didymodactylos carnosus]